MSAFISLPLPIITPSSQPYHSNQFGQFRRRSVSCPQRTSIIPLTALQHSTQRRPVLPHVLQPSSRMRNPGGFHLPPVVPDDADRLARAVQLIGCFTQRSRSMRVSTLDELRELVGDVPPNRLVAQQWKVALCRHIAEPSRLAHRNNVTAFRHRDALVRQLPLPNAQSQVSRMFILLEVLRKRYSTGVPVNPKVVSEITNTLGSCPTTVLEARRYIRALAYAQTQRKNSERLPPRIPLDDLEALSTANVLLSAYASRGSVGAQTAKLVSILGSSPRTRNVANSWGKIIAAAIRKKKRKDRVRAKRVLDNEKRRQRRLKRLQRDQLARSSDCSSQSADLKNNISNVTLTSQRLTPDGEAVRSEADFERNKKKVEARPNLLPRVSTMLGRLFFPR